MSAYWFRPGRDIKRGTWISCCRKIPLWKESISCQMKWNVQENAFLSKEMLSCQMKWFPLEGKYSCHMKWNPDKGNYFLSKKINACQRKRFSVKEIISFYKNLITVKGNDFLSKKQIFPINEYELLNHGIKKEKIFGEFVF